MRAVALALCAGSAAASPWGWVPPRMSTAAYTPQQGGFTPAPGAQYQMPVTFGETVKIPTPVENADVQIIEASFQTDASALLPFIPKQLELTSPVVTVSFKKCQNVSWLSGRTYNQITVTVPVRYTAPNGTVTEGGFAPVVWSDTAEAIQAGREAVNIPVVYANISYDGQSASAAWDYTSFLSIEHPFAATPAAAPAASRANLLNWGYVPSAVGAVVEASLSQLTMLPSDGTFAHSETTAACTLTWSKPRTAPQEPAPGYDAMPTEFRIVNTLAALPVRGAVQCAAKRGSESLRYDLATVLYDDLQQKHGAAQAPRGDMHGHFEVLPNVMYAMPVTFGGWPSSGSVGPAYYPDTQNLYIQYETDPATLLPFIPSGMKLMSPQITVSFARSYNVGWLAGRSYDMINLGVPVGYTNASGALIEASIDLVVWENCWEGCLLTGREMSGVPKIWADTVFNNGTEGPTTTKSMRAGWGGTEFLHLSATIPAPTPVPPSNYTLGHGFQWKYFPSPSDPTKPQISQLTDYPSSYRTKSYAAGSACTVEWLPGHAGSVTEAEMPTQHRVLNALASMPIVGSPTCGLSHMESILENGMSAVIDNNFMKQ